MKKLCLIYLLSRKLKKAKICLTYAGGLPANLVGYKQIYKFEELNNIVDFIMTPLLTDDYLLKKAKQNINAVKVKIENPVIWLMEIIKNEY